MIVPRQKITLYYSFIHTNSEGVRDVYTGFTYAYVHPNTPTLEVELAVRNYLSPTHELFKFDKSSYRSSGIEFVEI